MKKILIACGALAISLGFVACNNSSSSEANPNKGFADTLSTAIGELQGSQWAQNYLSLPVNDRDHFKKDEIIRGIEQVVMADTANQGYLSGLNIGMQIAGGLYQYEKAGIPVDRKAFMKEFAKAFKADTIDQQAFMLMQAKFEELNQRARKIAEAETEKAAEAARKAKEESPEAKENVAVGEKYVTAAKANDPSIVTTPTGLSYKVVKEGNGPKVGRRGHATVKYTGKLVDGTEFDSSDNASFTPGSVVPGFGEGLEMMQKGGQYTLIIPGNLAYGADGIPAAGIPPMATLVFDVEVLDVTPEE